MTFILLTFGFAICFGIIGTVREIRRDGLGVRPGPRSPGEDETPEF